MKTPEEASSDALTWQSRENLRLGQHQSISVVNPRTL